MPRDPHKELQAAEKALDEARRRRADIRRRIRSVQFEGVEVAEAISAALFAAGPRGEEPGPVVGELRDKSWSSKPPSRISAASNGRRPSRPGRRKRRQRRPV